MPERKLTELAPKYILNQGAIIGFRFECPSCLRNDANGVHQIRVDWDVWEVTERNDFDKVNVSPSILADTGQICQFHGWVKNGMVSW